MKALAKKSIRQINASNTMLTRSQAVARIADRTASQHLWGSRDVIGQPICHFLLVVLWNQASISNGLWDIQRQI